MHAPGESGQRPLRRRSQRNVIPGRHRPGRPEFDVSPKPPRRAKRLLRLRHLLLLLVPTSPVLPTTQKSEQNYSISSISRPLAQKKSASSPNTSNAPAKKVSRAPTFPNASPSTPASKPYEAYLDSVRMRLHLFRKESFGPVLFTQFG